MAHRPNLAHHVFVNKILFEQQHAVTKILCKAAAAKDVYHWMINIVKNWKRPTSSIWNSEILEWLMAWLCLLLFIYTEATGYSCLMMFWENIFWHGKFSWVDKSINWSFLSPGTKMYTRKHWLWNKADIKEMSGNFRYCCGL